MPRMTGTTRYESTTGERAGTLAAEPDTGFWLRAGVPGSPAKPRSVVAAETTARSISSYEPLVIPGLLQSAAYARELFRCSLFTPEQQEVRIAYRLSRQELLHKSERPYAEFFVHERALRNMVGDSRVMQEQSMHLFLAAAHGECVVRVVPRAVRSFAVMDSFSLYEYTAQPSAIYAESMSGGIFVDEPSQVALYRKVLERLRDRALSPEVTRTLLARLADA
ncbi:hypothetical protein HUW46_04323 [Amycolatopsis sp. CA-230715]|nr:hypothetical protein HUW46_04323 [Amycolatopsis sp. CA-230715]